MTSLWKKCILGQLHIPPSVLPDDLNEGRGGRGKKKRKKERKKKQRGRGEEEVVAESERLSVLGAVQGRWRAPREGKREGSLGTRSAPLCSERGISKALRLGGEHSSSPAQAFPGPSE